MPDFTWQVAYRIIAFTAVYMMCYEGKLCLGADRSTGGMTLARRRRWESDSKRFFHCAVTAPAFLGGHSNRQPLSQVSVGKTHEEEKEMVMVVVVMEVGMNLLRKRRVYGKARVGGRQSEVPEETEPKSRSLSSCLSWPTPDPLSKHAGKLPQLCFYIALPRLVTYLRKEKHNVSWT